LREEIVRYKVIVEQAHLPGIDDANALQRFATVLAGTAEFRVYAPSKATGSPLNWLDNSHVRQLSGYAEIDVIPVQRAKVLDAISREFEQDQPRSKGQIEVRSTEMTAESASVDKRKVFVVHGRNAKARDAVFTFLRAIDLAPMEWEEVIASTGKASPYIGEALETGFSAAQAAVVILTGDDMARVGKRYLLPHDPIDEKILTPQPRPNVLFEAGMALGRYPNRTVLVSLGSYRKFSDIDGRHIVYLSNKAES
jgi:predicted nucleotide-binding protein